ncbi:hypothetical protein EBS80_04240 [bacterium]|nr:hypothetical protein [bacterium]
MYTVNHIGLEMIRHYICSKTSLPRYIDEWARVAEDVANTGALARNGRIDVEVLARFTHTGHIGHIELPLVAFDVADIIEEVA